MKRLHWLDIYKLVSISALIIVGILFIVDSFTDIGEHSFAQLLVIISLNVIVSFVVLKKKE